MELVGFAVTLFAWRYILTSSGLDSMNIIAYRAASKFMRARGGRLDLIPVLSLRFVDELDMSMRNSAHVARRHRSCSFVSMGFDHMAFPAPAK